MLKISICIPQYNRIKYLLRSLKQIESQTYNNIEIVISDDGSTDDTVSEILKLKKTYKFPIIFSRNDNNLGYDRNYRKCIELATGDYCVIIGNDDTINGNDSIEYLCNFLSINNLPDIGFCNFVEDKNPESVVERAQATAVLGSGKKIALKYYSCFSFVGGLIYKRASFVKVNTNKHDGSIYSQIYLGCLMVASGSKLFSIKKPLILKDLFIDGKFRHSYRDRISTKWRDYKIEDGGMPSVINVVINAIEDAGVLDQNSVFKIFNRIYSLTFPHWILDYKTNGALPAAVGLIVGMNPRKNKNFHLLSFINRIRIFTTYFFSSFLGLITPSLIFSKFKNRLYKFYKK